MTERSLVGYAYNSKKYQKRVTRQAGGFLNAPTPGLFSCRLTGRLPQQVAALVAVGRRNVQLPGGGFMLCEVPGCRNQGNETHHWMTRGRYGKAALNPDNEIMLCADHHRLDGKAVHRMGRDRFARYFGLEERVERAREAVREKITCG